MPKRPYFRFSIVELTEEFNNNLNNKSNLQALQYELSYRKTPSAKRLAEQVDRHLKNLGIAGKDSFLENKVQKSPATVINRAKVPPFKKEYIQENNTESPCESNIVIDCATCQQANILKPIVGMTMHQCIGCGADFEVEYKNGLVRTVFVKEMPIKSSCTKNTSLYVVSAIILIVIILLVF